MKFRRETPYAFAPEVTAHKENYPDFYLRAIAATAPPIPEDWAVIIGDILTNARAALDHAVYPHVRARMPNMRDQDISYPIHNRKDQFVSKAGWFAPAVSDLIESTQPYNSPTPDEHFLAALRELVNIDKHRKLVIAQYAMHDVKIPEGDFYEVVNIELADQPLQLGVTAAEVHCRLTKTIRQRTQVVMNVDVEHAAEIPIPGTDGTWNMLGTLKVILKQIPRLLDELEALGC